MSTGLSTPFSRYFYPRPHMEGDTYLDCLAVTRRDFYPRPHMEGDKMIGAVQVDKDGFLSTPSHGGRRTSNWSGSW